MIRHGKEIDTQNLGEVIGSGGLLNLVLDSSKYQRPQDCSCGTRYRGHGTEHPKLPEALASWRGVYFRERYFHRDTKQCDDDARSFRIGPPAHLSEWAEPLLDSLYVLGLSNMMIAKILPKDAISYSTVWRRVHDLDPAGLNLHEVFHDRLQHDLLRWDRKGQKKPISEFVTMRVIEPPTAGLEVEVRRPIHQLTKRWIDVRILTSLQHPTQGNLSFNLL